MSPRHEVGALSPGWAVLAAPRENPSGNVENGNYLPFTSKGHCVPAWGTLKVQGESSGLCRENINDSLAPAGGTLPRLGCTERQELPPKQTILTSGLEKYLRHPSLSDKRNLRSKNCPLSRPRFQRIPSFSPRNREASLRRYPIGHSGH